jgi:hypothetical protein
MSNCASPWRINARIFATATAAHMKLFPLHLSPISRERRQCASLSCGLLFQAAFRRYSLTKHSRMVKCTSGNTLISFAVRQLAAAFLFPARISILALNSCRTLWNQSLTNWYFCKSFAVKSLQNARGVGGIASRTVLRTFHAPPFSTHLLCFDILAHSFAYQKMLTLLSSSTFALFGKNNRGWGYPYKVLPEVPSRPPRALLGHWPILFPEVESLSRDISCI